MNKENCAIKLVDEVLQCLTSNFPVNCRALEIVPNEINYYILKKFNKNLILIQ